MTVGCTVGSADGTGVPVGAEVGGFVFIIAVYSKADIEFRSSSEEEGRLVGFIVGDRLSDGLSVGGLTVGSGLGTATVGVVLGTSGDPKEHGIPRHNTKVQDFIISPDPLVPAAVPFSMFHRKEPNVMENS